MKEVKQIFLSELEHRFGHFHKLGESLSLFGLDTNKVIVYLRYSKIHDRDKTFYGLRKKDLQQLEGHLAFICLLWDGQAEPLFIPYADYEDVFNSTIPADDGQYKVQVLFQENATELYVAKAGKFNVEGYFGWEPFERAIRTIGSVTPELSHSQIQTLLGSIGALKNYDIWIPLIDRSKLDWTVAKQFGVREQIPHGFGQVESILNEIDVIWIQRGANDIKALFEVEHSTPIYSGLLRFNDIHLTAPNLHLRFSIIANSERRSLFVKQLNRPTFKVSGLGDLCAFLEYTDVYNWHRRIMV